MKISGLALVLIEVNTICKQNCARAKLEHDFFFVFSQNFLVFFEILSKLPVTQKTKCSRRFRLYGLYSELIAMMQF